MTITPEIYNSSHEKLDTLVEGNEKSSVTIVMVHGLGTDKHETNGQFDYIAHELIDSYRVVRFDFSGFGKSEGKMEDFDYVKHAEDLNAVLEYTKKIYRGTIYIVAQSMGCFVTSLLNPKKIEKTIFMGIPNSNTEYIIDRFSKRFSSKSGGVLNFEGISLIPRSTGIIQKIGPSFWSVLRDFNPVQSLASFSQNTKLLVLHPLQDEIVGSEFQKEYDAIPNIKIEWINGDHSFKKMEDRIALIKKIKDFFK